MPDTTKNISIQVQATQAINALTRTGNAMNTLGSLTGKTDSALRAAERQIAKSGQTIQTASATISRMKNEIANLNKAITVLGNTNTSLTGKLDKAKVKLREQQDTIKAQNALITTLVGKIAQLNTANNSAGDSAGRAAGKIREIGKAGHEAAGGIGELTKSFQENALRYALYDVGATTGALAGAGGAALKSVLGTSIDFQKNFANVIRTSQVSNSEVFADTTRATNTLKNAFLDLQSSIPVSSEDLAVIGTLGSQMGVAAQDITKFTEVTAKFSATAGLSADEAATSLSRIGQIAKVSIDDYDRLASSILKTGVNAIATEQQIVRGTTQIAAIGRVAGLTTVDVIALSSAMSSLGMSPELQRSIVTSSFTKILNAVQGSNEEAAKFGAIMKLSGEQFKEAWNEDAYGTYSKLLATISNDDNAIGILQELGLASQRLTPNLLKLGQSFDLLQQTRMDAQSGWDEDTELTRQYSEIAKTTAAAIQVLQQAWEAFLVVIGTDAINILGDVAKGITGLLNGLRDLANDSPILRGIGSILIVLVALGAGILAVTTFVSLAGASILGFNYVIEQLKLSLASGTGLLGTFTGGLAGVTTGSRVASLAVSGLATAFRVLMIAATAGLAILASAPAIGDAFYDAQANKQGFDPKSLQDNIDQVKKQFGSKDSFGTLAVNAKALRDMDKSFLDFNRSMGGGGVLNFEAFQRTDEALRDMVNSGNAVAAKRQLDDLKETFLDKGGDEETFKHLFVDTYDALSLVAQGAGVAEGGMESYFDGQEEVATEAEQVARGQESMAQALFGSARAFSTATDALEAYTGAFSAGASGFFDVSTLLENAYGDGEGQGGGLTRLKTDLDQSLTDFNSWADGISQLTAQGAGNFAVAMAAQGPASQQAIKDALALGPDALSALESSFADAAFFASDAYALAFASQNSVLADIYKKALEVDPNTALDALHTARDALMANGGVLSASDIAALEQQFGIEINLDLNPQVDPESVDTLTKMLSGELSSTPILIPVTTSVGQGDFEVTKQVQNWIVQTQNGNKLVLSVDPSTEQGQAEVNTWLASNSNKKITIGSGVNLSEADAALALWRARNNTLTVRVNVTGTSTLAGSNGVRASAASGGLVHRNQMFNGTNYPRFAKGAVLNRSILRGPGTGTSDSIIARVANGEAITQARAVRHYGTKFFDDINNMRLPKYATGRTPGRFPTFSSGGGPNVNVNVTQNYPTTRDPIKKLKADAESVAAGIWN